MKILKSLMIILSLVLVVSLISCNQTTNDNYSKKFKKIKVGMDPQEVTEIMGKPDESYTISQNYICDYWFVGANSIESAQEKTDRGIAVKYYGVIFYTQDFTSFKVISEDDIITGTWGKD